VLLNTSTALSGRLVSTINPRVIVLRSRTALAFNRGVQQVELLSRDRDGHRINFYLVQFEQACNAAPLGCLPGDLYTPRIESNWTGIRIEDDEMLKNTAADCRQCHQRARDRPMLLMRELDGPWTHFFMPDKGSSSAPEPSGVDVLRAYYRAKGNERYGNVPWSAIRATIGATLQNVAGRPQPVLFDGDAIMNERWPYDKDLEAFPMTPTPSPTWYREYAAFKRGEHLALPYFAPFPSDPDKLARMTDRYRAFASGQISAEELPDLSEVYPDDPQVCAEIGFQTEPHASPAEALVQACGSCHNDQLDQTISRARFNIDLSRMERSELALAAERVSLPIDDPLHMPPRDFRQLDPAARAPLVEYLKRGAPTNEDDALLRNAARIGMTIDVAFTSIVKR
jgi:hypothetical protein